MFCHDDRDHRPTWTLWAVSVAASTLTRLLAVPQVCVPQ